MNFRKIENIKNSIEFFEDAEFYSMAAKDKVIVKNVNNEILWEVPFTMTEGVMVFDGRAAKIVGEDIFDDESDEEMIEEDVDAAYGTNKLSDITKMVLNEEIDMDILKEKILSYQFKMEKRSNNYENNYSYEENKKEEKSKNTKIYSLFKKQIVKYEEEKEKFLNNGYLFNENDEIKKEFIVDPVHLTTLYEEKIENSNKFFTFIEHEYANAMAVVEKVNQAFKDTKIPTNELFENIDFTDKDNIKTKVVKNLLMIKKKHGLTFSLNEMTKKVDNLLEKLYPMLEEIDTNGEGKFSNATAGLSQLATGDPRFPDRNLKFLKIGFGVFSRDDVMKLAEELNLAINTLYNQEEDPENYRMLFVMRNALDYMIRKNMIDDNIVINIIKTFNDRYGTDSNQGFNDAEKGIPFSPSVYGMKNVSQAISSEM